MTSTIIAIDDEVSDLLLLEEYLAGEGYDLKCFSSTAAALEHIHSDQAVDVILLDCMIPELDELAFMKTFKSLPCGNPIPVIMQTAAAPPSQIAKGISASPYYYLTKPYTPEAVRAVLSRALSDRATFLELQHTANSFNAAKGHINTLEMAFNALGQIADISFLVASLYPNAELAILGIREMMLNAIEHGNLGITYKEKAALIGSGTWLKEIERRLLLPQYALRTARLHWTRNATELVLTIEDEGDGFDWAKFLDFDPSRMLDPHGRGISMSRMVSFDEVLYVAPGNKVICRKRLL